MPSMPLLYHMVQDHVFLATIGLAVLSVLAAATGAYEAYFQLIKDGGGRYWVEVDRLHHVYGPIVRISPREVHIKDPDWNDVYKLSSRAAKPWSYYRFFGRAQSTNTTGPDALHRVHRQALGTWFSPQNVAAHAHQVRETVDKLHDRIAGRRDQVVNLSDAYRALALDVSTGFAFQRPFGGLDQPDFGKAFNRAVWSYARLGLLNRHLFGFPFWLLQSLLPRSVSNRLSPEAARVFMESVHECAAYSFNQPTSPEAEVPRDMMQAMLAADLPEKQKTFTRVLGDCRSVVLAGNETTATILTSITYHVLSNPEMRTKLRNELRGARDAKDAALGYQDLRALPYLTGIINEALRTSYPVSGRLPRYSEVADFEYQQYFLPRGTHISINMHDAHMDPAIFSEPEKFIPDRWLKQSDSKRLARYLQPWGRGSRLCIGKELATMDVYLTVSRLFGPGCAFEMTLFETERSDWDIFGDYFGPLPAPGSRGLRVMVGKPQQWNR